MRKSFFIGNNSISFLPSWVSTVIWDAIEPCDWQPLYNPSPPTVLLSLLCAQELKHSIYDLTLSYTFSLHNAFTTIQSKYCTLDTQWIYRSFHQVFIVIRWQTWRHFQHHIQCIVKGWSEEQNSSFHASHLARQIISSFKKFTSVLEEMTASQPVWLWVTIETYTESTYYLSIFRTLPGQTQFGGINGSINSGINVST